MIRALKFFGVSVLVSCSAVVWAMTVYVLKQIKWEASLKYYHEGSLGGVINRQGHQIFTAKELLDELKGIEEKIAK